MCMAKDTWYVEQDVTTLGTPGSLECLFNPCMTLLSHPARKACLENSQVDLKAMSSLGLLEGRKNVGTRWKSLFSLKS